MCFFLVWGEGEEKKLGLSLNWRWNHNILHCNHHFRKLFLQSGVDVDVILVFVELLFIENVFVTLKVYFN
jgi:hypothetical protein